MAYDQMTLINGACGEIGADPLDALDEDTPSGRAATLHYDGLLEYCIGVYEFPFAMELRQLSQRADVTQHTGYSYVYALPGDRIEDPIKCAPTAAAFTRGHFTDYTIIADDLYSDETTMFGLMRVRPHPARMSPTFRAAFQRGLAGMFAMAIASDKALKAQLWQEAFGPPTANGTGGMMGAAIQAARKTQPSTGVWTGSDPLTSAWSFP
jgi:hypothetical protein